MYKCKHFKIHELVPKHIYEARGEKAWELLDERLLITIDALREAIGTSVTINNYHWGGDRNWSGLRTAGFYSSLSEYDKSLSQHKYGRAVDMIFKNKDAESVRQYIYANKEKFPYISFIETKVSWVHIDVRNCKAITTWAPDGTTGLK